MFAGLRPSYVIHRDVRDALLICSLRRNHSQLHVPATKGIWNDVLNFYFPRLNALQHAHLALLVSDRYEKETPTENKCSNKPEFSIVLRWFLADILA